MNSILNSIFKQNDVSSINELNLSEKNILIGSILAECAKVDGNLSLEELNRIRYILKNKLKIEDKDVISIFDKSIENANKSIEIYSLSKEIREKFDKDEILKIFEYMWEIILIDGKIDDFESALMRNFAGLFHITGKESSEAKNKASENINN